MNTSSTVPTSAIRLESMIATLWQISSMTAISCVITMMVMPSVLLISLSSARIDRVVVGSSALVASSHSRISGWSQVLVQSPHAAADRRTAGSDSYPHGLTDRRSQAAHAPVFPHLLCSFPAISSGKQIFCSAVLCCSRLNCWKIIPIDRRARAAAFCSVCRVPLRPPLPCPRWASPKS